MPDVAIRLTLAERQGLSLYSRALTMYSKAERAKVRIEHDPRRRLPEDVLRVLIGGKPPVTVSLERVSADVWEGTCTCDVGMNCIHCAAAADSLLAEGGGAVATVGRPSKQAAQAARAKTVGITQKVTSILGRGLLASEMAYLHRVEAGYLRAVSTGSATSHDIMVVTESGGTLTGSHGYHTIDAWPTFPSEPLLYWHAMARQARMRGLAIPPFMERVAEQSPPPKEWLAAWEKADINAWVRRLEEAERSLDPNLKAEAGPGYSLDIRLVLTPKAPKVEVWTSQEPEWATVKKSALSGLVDDYFDDNAFAPLPEAAPMWDPLAREIDNSFDFELTYQGAFNFQRLLAQFLAREGLRSRILTEDHEPYTFAPEPLRWDMRPPSEGSPHYRFTLVQADGSVPTGLFALLKGPPAFGISATTIFRLPPIPDALRAEGATLVPAKAIESEAGIRLLNRLGVALPESLRELTEILPLHLHLHFDVASPDTAYKPIDRLTIRASARTASNQTVDAFKQQMWIHPKGRPSKATRITLYNRDQILNPVSVLHPLGARWDDSADGFTMRITRGFPEVFATWYRGLAPSVVVDLPDLLKTILADPVQAQVTLKATSTDVDWFDLSVEVSAQNTDLTKEELNLLLGARGGYVRLGDKGWRRAVINLSPEDTEQLAHIGLNPLELTHEPQRLHALQLSDEATRKLLPEAQAEQIRLRASEIKTRVTPPIPEGVNVSLRPYQLEGFHFLAYLAENNFGGVLADDMGLGKTVQTLTWIAWLRTRPAPAPTAEGGVAPSRILIVCPKSVAPNWRAEATRFLPNLRVAVWQGQPATEFAATLADCDALVLNFAHLRNLQDQLANQPWLALIIDEAQAIKNPDSQTAQAARSLKACHRLALTGTPIENKLLDLWSILAFAMPGALGARAVFQKTFGKTADGFARQRLSARVRPFLLRRTKSQVAQDLPPRIEEDLICELEGVQRDLYRAEYKKARTLLLKVKTSADLDQLRFHFLTSLLRLRQICCHPALVDKRQLKQPSAKVESLMDVLEPLMEEGNKVLIFSQFVTMLDLLQAEIRERKWTDFYLAGDTEDRGPLVEAFNAFEGAAVFLISLKAGGFGLNLTSASYVVLFDPWWNPAVESQAIDRTHRIGQKNTVIAYRLLVKGSIEEKIRELQKQKSALAIDILGEERFSQALSIDDLQYLFNADEPTL